VTARRTLAFSGFLVVVSALAIIAVVSLRGSGPVPIAPLPVGPHPNGPIWFIGGDQPGSTFGRSGLFWIDRHARRTHGVDLPNSLYSITRLAVSPDGAWLAVSNGGGEFPPRTIDLLRADGSDFRKLTSGHEDVDPAWSPDGSSIVFASNRCCETSQGFDGYALYAMGTDGSGVHQLTHPLGTDWAPAWSPDGTRIAYVALPPNVERPPPDRVWKIWIMNADGTDAHPLTHEHRFDDAVAWSPDGTRLAYASHLVNERDWQIRVMRTDGSNPHPVFTCVDPCKQGGYSLAWSPDGTRIAFTVTMKSDGSRPRIAVIDRDGGGFHLLNTHGVEACCLSWPAAPSARGRTGTMKAR
jgi:Tol biopolymer transport system component